MMMLRICYGTHASCNSLILAIFYTCRKFLCKCGEDFNVAVKQAKWRRWNSNVTGYCIADKKMPGVPFTDGRNATANEWC